MLRFYYKDHVFYTCYFIVASNPAFRDFEKTFSNQIIDPKDLIIKEQIGEGEYIN